jgi:hypothetical protein
LQDGHTVNEWLTQKATVEPILRIEAELGTGFFDGDYAIVLGDIVDAGLAARDGEDCCVRRRIDMQRRLALGSGVPSPRSVEEPIAQYDSYNSLLFLQDSLLHVSRTLHRDCPHGIGQIERIGFGVRLAAGRIGEGDALNDEPAC